jgi:muramoyltetrapeptide carboxypeptidase
MQPIRVAVVAPGRRLEEATAQAVTELLAASPFARRIDLRIHPQCFLSYGHFAGPDAARLEAFVEVANDPQVDAVWFARGGYGAARLLPGLAGGLGPAARHKVYLGYSDTGFLLAALESMGCGFAAHGPMVADIARPGGDQAVLRALAFLSRNGGTLAERGMEPGMAGASAPALAFNLTIVRSLVGTPWLPPPAGRELLLEDVAEYAYATDRSMVQLAHSEWFRQLAGVRIGRFSDVPQNDVPFPLTPEQSVSHWSASAGIPVNGSADIGHDAANRIVPFGALDRWRQAGWL